MKFKDYEREKAKWVTTAEGRYYPDSLEDAKTLYGPTIKRFGELLSEVKRSADLFRLIMNEPQPARIQLLRVFRKYVSPATSVEMLKRKSDMENIVANFGDRFRLLGEVQRAFKGRPKDDDALVALLHEYSDRGTTGYTLTGTFFEWFESEHGKDFTIKGPTGAGRDVMLDEELPNFEKRVPADFIIRDRKTGEPIAVGFAHYDSDRGGGQEDDRTSSNDHKVSAIMAYNAKTGRRTKVIFLNDGPGLCLGSMWRDYVSIEERDPDSVLVVTLKMLKDRLTKDWLRG